MRDAKLIVEECVGCTLPNTSDGTCTAFLDPAWQHRGGRRCHGRCDSIDEMVRRLEDMAAYNLDNWRIEQELLSWREIQRLIS